MKWKMISLYFRLDELAALEKTVDVPNPPHVIWDNTENITLGGEGATYYEQYTIPGPKITHYLMPNGTGNSDLIQFCST